MYLCFYSYGPMVLWSSETTRISQQTEDCAKVARDPAQNSYFSPIVVHKTVDIKRLILYGVLYMLAKTDFILYQVPLACSRFLGHSKTIHHSLGWASLIIYKPAPSTEESRPSLQWRQFNFMPSFTLVFIAPCLYEQSTGTGYTGQNQHWNNMSDFSL